MNIKKIHYSTAKENEVFFNLENNTWNILCNPNIKSLHIHGTTKKRLVNCNRCLSKIKKLEEQNSNN